MDKILEEIKQERVKQNFKWGVQDHLPIEWIAILTEEVGEAAKEALDHHFKNPYKDGREVFEANEITQECRMRDYRKEMIQVAAVAVQMIECLDRNYEK